MWLSLPIPFGQRCCSYARNREMEPICIGRSCKRRHSTSANSDFAQSIGGTSLVLEETTIRAKAPYQAQQGDNGESCAAWSPKS